jgi:23S rRNA (uracil1939-C5)-methyltransferase
MLLKNDHVSLEVIDLGEHGEGIGKINDFTVFVHGGIPGDEVEVKIIKVKKSYAIGKVTKILKKSDLRVVPECPYIECGGCQIQMVDYGAQLAWKQADVYATFKRIGGLEDHEVKPVLGMDDPFAYRNKSQYPVRRENGHVEIGFYKQRTHDLVAIDHCMVQHPLINKIMKSLRNILANLDMSVYDESSHRGFLRHIVTRISYETRDVMLIFVTNGEDHSNNRLKEICEILHAKFPEIKSFIQNINSHKGNRVLGYKNVTLMGNDKITDYIMGHAFEISPLSFLQVNPIQTKVLYEKALDLAKIKKTDTVFDVYCGIGTISLFLADYAKEVYGIEIVEDAIKDANENKVKNNVENVSFYAGPAEVIVPDLYKKGMTADVVILDPPRKGCEEAVLKTLLEMKPEKIVYISCKVSTLARDIKFLSDLYKVEEIQPVDLFPHTTHVETVVKLKLYYN